MQLQRRRLGRQPQSQPQPQYYTAITQFADPDRLAKLLELGSPRLFDGGSSNFVKSDELAKLSSASITTKSDDRLSSVEVQRPTY